VEILVNSSKFFRKPDGKEVVNVLTKIRFVRMLSGKTALEISRKMGISDSLVCGIERGKVACPIRLRSKIATYLNKRPEELFDEHGFPLFVETQKEVA